MLQQFTESGHQAMRYAQEETRLLNEEYVSTEHLLLGLLRVKDSVAERVLAALGVSFDQVRAEIHRSPIKGWPKPVRELPLTPRARTITGLAYDAALEFGDDAIGTEHLLLGLVQEGEGLAGRVLGSLGVTAERLNNEIQKQKSFQKSI